MSTVYAFWYRDHEHPSVELGMVSADTAEQAMDLLIASDEVEASAMDRRSRGRRREPRLDPSTIEARPIQTQSPMLVVAHQMHADSAATLAETLARGDGEI